MGNPKYKSTGYKAPIFLLPDPPAETPHPVIIKAIVQKALKNKMWLFHKNEKVWYSPEEYLAMNERILDDGGRKDWRNILILDPLDGLIAADQQMENIKEKRAALEKKVVEYYRNKVK